MRFCSCKFLLLCFLVWMFSAVHVNAYAAGKVRVVVIDPGHGGVAPGAVGEYSKEKDITLAVSLQFGKMIEDNFEDVKVVYTRKDDSSVEIWKRSQLANQHKADLFISIHCNSSENKAAKPRGFETFVMGLHKSGESIKVAQKENAEILLERDHADKYESYDPHSPDAYIIFTLFQSAFLDQSSIFAEKLQKHYRKNINSIDRGVKQDGFLVLYKSAMPAVLTEIGFINTPEEEKFMNSKEGQAKIVKSLFDAFKEYKFQVEGFNNQLVADQVPEERKEPLVSPSVVQKENVDVEDTQIVFKVQVASSSSDKPLTASEFKNLEDVSKHYANGVYRFCAGRGKTMEEAQKLLKVVHETGFTDAFITVYRGNERISVQEAIDLIKEKK